MNAWLQQWFSAQACSKGGIIRRNRRDIDRFTSMDAVIREVKKRKWHVVEIGDQVVVLCNDGDMKVHC